MGDRRITTAKLSLLLAAASVVCSAQMSPIDSGDYAAKAIQVTGRVSVLRDAAEYAIVEGGQVHVKELIFTGPDGSARFQVSDGSTFDVYPNSRVIFRKNVPNWRDLLDVLVGRVKVHIEHWGNQPNHNRVLTPTAVISVRGTTFDISVDDDDETTVVEVEEGIVEVQHALLPRGNARTLTAGESMRVYRNEPIATNKFDKGEFLKRGIRMGMDAMNTWHGMPRSGGGVAGAGGGSGSGDTHKIPPPPTNAPSAPGAPGAPPPPPPPGGGFTTSGHAIYIHGQSQGPQTRWHKIGHAILVTVERFVFGRTPEEEVIRAVGR
jgi:FecR protein